MDALDWLDRCFDFGTAAAATTRASYVPECFFVACCTLYFVVLCITAVVFVRSLCYNRAADVFAVLEVACFFCVGCVTYPAVCTFAMQLLGLRHRLPCHVWTVRSALCESFLLLSHDFSLRAFVCAVVPKRSAVLIVDVRDAMDEYASISPPTSVRISTEAIAWRYTSSLSDRQSSVDKFALKPRS